MVPPPPPSKVYTSIKGPHFPKTQGERKKFFELQREHKPLYPIGTVVMIKYPSMRSAIGPGKITEHCKAMHPGGPPQYIISPLSDNSRNRHRWQLVNERYVYEAAPADLEAAAGPRRFNYEVESDDEASGEEDVGAEFNRVAEDAANAIIRGNAIVYDNEIEV